MLLLEYNIYHLQSTENNTEVNEGLFMWQLDGLYRPLDFFMIRTPILPIQRFQELFRTESVSDTDKSALASAVETLAEWSQDPVVREAIAVASPSLLESLPNLLHCDNPRKQEQALRGFLRYMLRMITRPTPFGLCSGVTHGEVGEQSVLALQSLSRHRKRTRPDMEWLFQVIKRLELDGEVVAQLRVQTNSMSYRHGNRVKLPYVARYGQSNTGDKSSLERVSVRVTPVVELVLQEAKSPVSFGALLEKIQAAFPGAANEMVRRFLLQLIQQEFLITELRPPATEMAPFANLLEKLRGVQGAEAFLQQLREIADGIEAYDQLSIGAGEESYLNLVKRMRKIAQVKSPLQVDLSLAKKQATLHHSVVEEVTRAANILWRISPEQTRLAHLQEYRDEFIEQYGREREIPVLELLDEEMGLGTPATYEYPPSRRSFFKKSSSSEERDALLLSWVSQTVARGELELELTDEMVNRLAPVEPRSADAPPSLELNVSLFASSWQSIDEGNCRLIVTPYAGSQGAGKTFGRFLDLMDDELLLRMGQVQAAEQSLAPERIFAEMNHLPSDGRAANVVLTRNLRPYEITLGTCSSRGEEETIPLSDLMISCPGESFVIRSRSLDKEVVPAAGHMLNPQTAPNVYRFLCEAAEDGQSNWSLFQWGAAKVAPFLPRVRYGRVILSLATWKIHKKAGLLPTGLSKEQWIAALQKWREEWNVPRHVYLTDRDNRILLDLEHPLLAELLRIEVEKSDEVTLMELGHALSETVVSGEGEGFLAELVFPLVKQMPAQQKIASKKMRSARARSTAGEQRVYFPGSEWLYVKLYGAGNRQEELIGASLREFCALMQQDGVTDNSYFLRYADPKPHIRLRFHGQPERLMTGLMPKLHDWAQQLQTEGLLSEVVIASYQPEIERYGGTDLMKLAEDMFARDSEMVASVVAAKRFGNMPLDMELVGVMSVLDMMNGFGLSLEEQFRWLDTRFSRKEYLVEFREKRRRYLQVCDPARDGEALQDDVEGMQIAQWLKHRVPAVLHYAENVRRMDEIGELTSAVEEIMASVMHMHLNRLFGIDREQERKVMILSRHVVNGLRQLPKRVLEEVTGR